MTRARHISSVKAWFVTGFLSALCAVVLFLCFVFLAGGDGGGTTAILHVLGIYETVHIGSCAIIGLPFFLYYWPRVDSLVWRVHFALPLGFTIGYLAMFFFFFLFSGFELSWIDKGALFGCLVGGIYGLGTALIAWVVSNFASSRT